MCHATQAGGGKWAHDDDTIGIPGTATRMYGYQSRNPLRNLWPLPMPIHPQYRLLVLALVEKQQREKL